jgi:hypothetical protein
MNQNLHTMDGIITLGILALIFLVMTYLKSRDKKRPPE